MATVDFSRTFGSPMFGGKNSNRQNNEEREKAQFWLNVGYQTGDENYTFVALPAGIALDSQEHFPIRGNNQEFKAFRSASNGLLDQIMEVAKSLNPGEEKILNLQVQLRRVNDEQVDIPAESNPLAFTGSLVG